MLKNGEDDTIVVEAKFKVIGAAVTISCTGDFFCRYFYIL